MGLAGECVPMRKRGVSQADQGKTNVSDNMVLVQLGTANPGRTDEERQRWTEGLKAVVQDLRKNNIKDSEVVAASIAAYRRQFLNDSSRVLTL